MADFAAVHERLRHILEPYRADLSVTRDGPDGLVLEVPGLEGKPWGYVAGTRVGKRYVSFHLMPVYSHPSLAAKIPPDLKKRMQGKSCFNFKAQDPALFDQLEALTREAAAVYAKPFRIEGKGRETRVVG